MSWFWAGLAIKISGLIQSCYRSGKGSSVSVEGVSTRDVTTRTPGLWDQSVMTNEAGLWAVRMKIQQKTFPKLA